MQDFRSYKYFALLNGNSHPNGFKNRLFLSNSLQDDNFSGQGFFFCSYDYKNHIENLRSKNPSPLKFKEVVFFKPEKIIDTESVPALFESRLSDTPIHLSLKTSKEDYIHTVNKIKQHIQNGDVYEINYCITFEAQGVTIDPFTIFSKLNSISKAPYSALVKMDDKYIISASPELFLSKKESKLFTKPIKGTAKRSLTPIDDEHYKKDLLNSLKERTENVMIVDVARNDLSRIAKKGSVVVEKLYDIETYEQVHQMVSTISCELKENTSLKNIILATFPMASMTGAPKIRAMELIDDYENFSRGPFSGCLGYIDEQGDFDLSVLIRSIFYNSSENYLSFSVGSAITSLCDPEKEYEECLLKAAAMKKVLEE